MAAPSVELNFEAFLATNRNCRLPMTVPSGNVKLSPLMLQPETLNAKLVAVLNSST